MKSYAGALAVMIAVWLAAAVVILVTTEPALARRLWTWGTRRRRPAVFVAALGLVLVPTLFTVFPRWGATWWIGSKIAVLFVWLVAALVAAAGSLRQSEQPEDIAERLPAARRRVAAERRNAIVPFLLDTVLAQPPGVPVGHSFRVYMPDESEQVLRPVYEPPGAESGQVWDVGRGATGVAWATHSRVLAQGTAVHDETFHLTADERARYERLKSVAAVPITLASGDMIGVLTASSETHRAFLATPEGTEAHVFLAAVCGEILSLEE